MAMSPVTDKKNISIVSLRWHLRRDCSDYITFDQVRLLIHNNLFPGRSLCMAKYFKKYFPVTETSCRMSNLRYIAMSHVTKRIRGDVKIQVLATAEVAEEPFFQMLL